MGDDNFSGLTLSNRLDWISARQSRLEQLFYEQRIETLKFLINQAWWVCVLGGIALISLIECVLNRWAN
jgi:hypothetical protein